MKNIINDLRVAEFVKSPRVKEILTTADNIKSAQIRFITIVNKLDNLIMGLESDRGILDFNFNEGNVDGVEATAEIMEAKLEALDDKKFLAGVVALEAIFGIEEAKAVDTVKEAKEALGFKTK